MQTNTNLPLQQIHLKKLLHKSNIDICYLCIKCVFLKYVIKLIYSLNIQCKTYHENRWRWYRHVRMRIVYMILYWILCNVNDTHPYMYVFLVFLIFMNFSIIMHQNGVMFFIDIGGTPLYRLNSNWFTNGRSRKYSACLMSSTHILILLGNFWWNIKYHKKSQFPNLHTVICLQFILVHIFDHVTKIWKFPLDYFYGNQVILHFILSCNKKQYFLFSIICDYSGKKWTI